MSNRHRFMDGRKTPKEVHWQFMNLKCHACGRPAIIRIMVFISVYELVTRHPEISTALIASSPGGIIPTTKMRDGQEMVRVSDIGACASCRKDAEQAAAKQPSWAYVDIDRGPADIPIQVGYER